MTNESASLDFNRFIEHSAAGLIKIAATFDTVGTERWRETPVQGLRSAQDILVHMREFEEFWAARLRGDDSARRPPADPAGGGTLASFMAGWSPVRTWWSEYAATLNEQELNRPVELPWRDSSKSRALVRHVLSQYVQHQGQHRSELAVLVSAMGASPVEFDIWDFWG